MAELSKKYGVQLQAPFSIERRQSATPGEAGQRENWVGQNTARCRHRSTLSPQKLPGWPQQKVPISALKFATHQTIRSQNARRKNVAL
jgi:hypothetical protein